MENKKFWLPAVLILALGSAWAAKEKEATTSPKFGEVLYAKPPCNIPVNCSPSGTGAACKGLFFDINACLIVYNGPDKRV